MNAHTRPRISEPGIYDLPMDAYHGDIAAGPSISSSGLRTIQNECPLHYWAFSYLNPDRYPPEDKPAFNFGRAAHCLMIGGEVFDERYAVRPDELDGAAWHGNRKVCKQWMSDVPPGITVITEDELAGIREMAAVLRKLPITASLLEGQVEKSLIWKDSETGVWLKARPDVLNMPGRIVADYKTTVSRVKPYDLQRDISSWGYHQQIALMAEGIELLLGETALNFVLVFQSKKPPYHVTPIELSPEYVDLGRRQNRRAIRTFARCLETGVWPGYVDGIPVAEPPEWMVREFETTTAGD